MFWVIIIQLKVVFQVNPSSVVHRFGHSVSAWPHSEEHFCLSVTGRPPQGTAPFWPHLMRLLSSLLLYFSNTSYPPFLPLPHSLLLCSPQSPPKGATIPYRPKPASTPVIFSGGQVRADPLGASTANLSLLLQHQPLPVSVAPGFTHSSPLSSLPPYRPPPSGLAWNVTDVYGIHHSQPLKPELRYRRSIRGLGFNRWQYVRTGLDWKYALVPRSLNPIEK